MNLSWILRHSFIFPCFFPKHPWLAYHPRLSQANKEVCRLLPLGASAIVGVKDDYHVTVYHGPPIKVVHYRICPKAKYTVQSKNKIKNIIIGIIKKQVIGLKFQVLISLSHSLYVYVWLFIHSRLDYEVFPYILRNFFLDKQKCIEESTRGTLT